MQEFIAILRDLALIDGRPYSRPSAFLDILLMANKNNGKVHMSERKFMERWGWSNRKVRSFIKYLEERSIIEAETEQKRSTILLVNSRVLEVLRSRNEAETKQKRSRELTITQLQNMEIYKRIINYLNNRCGTKYRHESKDTEKIIQERLDEGFTEEDFYTVIDKKANEWIGTKWEEYLRPYTLFRKDKFENYLNQKVIRNESTGNAYLDAIKNRVSIVDTWMED